MKIKLCAWLYLGHQMVGLEKHWIRNIFASFGVLPLSRLRAYTLWKVVNHIVLIVKYSFMMADSTPKMAERLIKLGYAINSSSLDAVIGFKMCCVSTKPDLMTSLWILFWANNFNLPRLKAFKMVEPLLKRYSTSHAGNPSTLLEMNSCSAL